MRELYMDLEQPNYSHLKDLKGVDLELLCDVEGQFSSNSTANTERTCNRHG